MLPVWFFIGILLTIYGAIILVTSLDDFSQPTAVALARYHAGLYGGVVLLFIGSFYTIWFWPTRRNRK
jgi:cbb3-type cytochrome oxidase subunit 1